jgi:hypothetical protein
LSISAFTNFTIGAVSVNALLTASASTATNLIVCCGVTGVAWHYVQAGPSDIVQSITLNVTGGSMTSSSTTTGNVALPPGILVIPAGSFCTNFDPIDVLLGTVAGLKSKLTFSSNLNSGSAGNSLTLNLDSSLQVPGVSYWVLVISSSDSSGQYNIEATISSTASDNGGSAATIHPFYHSLLGF